MPTHKRLERHEKTSTRQVEAINRYQRAKNRKIHKHTHVLALSACLQPWPVPRTRSPVISMYTGYEAYCYWQSHHSCRHQTLIASHFTLRSLSLSLSILSAFFLFSISLLFANIVSPQITATVLSNQLCKHSLRFHPRISYFRSIPFLRKSCKAAGFLRFQLWNLVHPSGGWSGSGSFLLPPLRQSISSCC